ncbi:MAG: helix-turn-helix domain-containing protein [Pseudomonadota bacterium]|nr:helix-turn-helix domain-containing protein [Pseudomonadota bacterium]
MPAPTVAFEIYTAVFQYLEKLGYPAETLCEHLNIKSSQDYRINGRVPLSLYERALIAGEHITNDPAFGMRMGGTGFPAHLGVYYFLSMTAKDVSQVMDSVSKFLPLSFDFIRLEMETDEECLRTVFRYQGPRPHRHVIEYMTAYWYSVADQMTFNTNNVPRTLYLQNEQCCEDAVVNEIFQSTKLLFNQSEDRFDLRLDSLSYHSNLTDQNLFNLSESRAVHLLMQLRSEDRIAREICTHVTQMLIDGAPGINEVAKRMNCSGRTLQRRLAERNLSYQMLLDYVRKDMAIELLCKTTLPITQIASRTGFADDSTFHRAFRRWTGLSPGSYRH